MLKTFALGGRYETRRTPRISLQRWHAPYSSLLIPGVFPARKTQMYTDHSARCWHAFSMKATDSMEKNSKLTAASKTKEMSGEQANPSVTTFDALDRPQKSAGQRAVLDSSFIQSLLQERPPPLPSKTLIRENLAMGEKKAPSEGTISVNVEDINIERLDHYASMMRFSLQRGDIERARRVFARLRLIDNRILTAAEYNEFFAKYVSKIGHQRRSKQSDVSDASSVASLSGLNFHAKKTNRTISPYIDVILSRWRYFGPRKPGDPYRYPINTTDVQSLRHTDGSEHILEEIVRFYDDMKYYRIIPDTNTFVHILHAAALCNDDYLGQVLLNEFARWGHNLLVLSTHPSITEAARNVLAKWTHQFTRVVALPKEEDEDEEAKEELGEGQQHDKDQPSTRDLDSILNSPAVNELPFVPRKGDTALVKGISDGDMNMKFMQTEGLKELQQALRPLKCSSANLYQLQQDLEMKSVDVAVQRFQNAGEHVHLNYCPNPRLNALIVNWQKSLLKGIREERQRIEAGGNAAQFQNILNTLKEGTQEELSQESTFLDDSGSRSVYGPFLMLLSPEKLSVIALNELIGAFHSASISGCVRSARLMVNIGRAVESEIHLEQLVLHKDALHMSYLNHEKLRNSGKLFNMSLRRALSHVDETTAEFRWMTTWPTTLRARIGAVLTKLMLDNCSVKVERTDALRQRITESMDAFHHSYLFDDGKKVGAIKSHAVIEDLLATSCSRDFIHPRLLPMVVPPRLWVKYNSGGYLFLNMLCMRTHQCPEQIDHLKAANASGRLNTVLAGLDVLGSTPWKINEDTLKVLELVWNNGGGQLGVPSRTDVPVPEMPADYEDNPHSRKTYIRQKRAVQTANRNLHSLRCDVNYKLEIASQYRGQLIYFPHSLDFRGRAYPIPPLLNHLGSDLCRGLMKFADGRPLGEQGLYWLKVQLSNLYGVDKVTFDERVAFVDKHLSMIMDSADHSLDGQRWWQKAEDPWQCLAACIELTRAVRSADPTQFVSHLPVHLDGSCNGLQHYAALGGDTEGAKGVNLIPSDNPQDVYSAVAQLVEMNVRKDADTHDMAKKLMGRISRKVVKQTVMTNVYGVTFVGAKNQIEERLAELGDFNSDEIPKAGSYLANKVFQSLRQMFRGAREIQDWLTHSAREIALSVEPADVLKIRTQQKLLDAAKRATAKRASEEKEAVDEPSAEGLGSLKKKSASAVFAAKNTMAVSWTTPMGLTIVQPYRKFLRRQVKTCLQTVLINEFDIDQPVDVAKQKGGFPPNFIHSLDATHMLMTAHACHERNITFASVHDSYWTHASSIGEMNVLIRDMFIKLHSQSIMENLRNEFIRRYGHRWVPDQTSKGWKPKRKEEDDSGKETNGRRRSSGSDDMADIRHECPSGYRPIRFRPVPKKGEFHIQEVKNSLYFFD